MSQKGTRRSNGTRMTAVVRVRAKQIEAGDAVESDEGNAHGSEGDGGGVGEQGEAGGLERAKAEADEDGGADGDGRAEAGRRPQKTRRGRRR